MDKEKIKIGIVTIVALAIGFFGGMEYKAYQIRSTIEDAFSGVFGDDKETEQEVKDEKVAETKEVEKPVNDL